MVPLGLPSGRRLLVGTAVPGSDLYVLPYMYSYMYLEVATRSSRYGTGTC